MLAMACLGAMLAQTDGSGDGSGVAGAIGWSIVVIAVCVGAFFVYSQLKRWVSTPDTPADAVGFSFSDLRRMHRQGQLTDQEFEIARSRMAAAAKKITDELPDPLAGRSTPPPPAPINKTRG